MNLHVSDASHSLVFIHVKCCWLLSLCSEGPFGASFMMPKHTVIRLWLINDCKHHLASSLHNVSYDFLISLSLSNKGLSFIYEAHGERLGTVFFFLIYSSWGNLMHFLKCLQGGPSNFNWWYHEWTCRSNYGHLSVLASVFLLTQLEFAWAQCSTCWGTRHVQLCDLLVTHSRSLDLDPLTRFIKIRAELDVQTCAKLCNVTEYVWQTY